MKDKLKKLLFAFICFIIFPLFVLFCLEFGLKLIGIKSIYEKKFEAKSRREFKDEHSFYLLDKDLIWRLQPDTSKVVDGYLYKINSYGMRSPEFKLEKEEGVFRIVVLGDSSTFGLNLPYDEIYHQYLLRNLQRRYPGKKFEVINLGVPGYSSKQGAVLFRRWGARLKPDLVIASFGANDGYSIPDDVYGDMEIVGASTTWAVHLRSQLERLRLVTIVNYLVGRLKDGDARSEGKTSSGVKCRVRPEGYEENIRSIALQARKLGAPAIFLNISIAPPYLEVLKKLSDAGEIIFCDVETPLRELYYSEGKEKFLRKFPQKQIKAPMNPEIDAMCTDLLGEEQMAIRRDRALFTDDFHPNAPGNYIIAKALLRKIEELELTNH